MIKSLGGRQVFGSGRFKISLDESFNIERDTEVRREKWRYLEVRGRYGTLYPYSVLELHGFVESAKIAGRLESEGFEIVKSGGGEAVFRVPEARAAGFLQAIRARRKRQLTPEQRQMAVERLGKYRFKGETPARKPQQNGLDSTEAIKAGVRTSEPHLAPFQAHE